VTIAGRFRLSTLLEGRLRELLVAPEAVLRHAALPSGLLRQEKILVTTEELFAFWAAVAAVSGDPAIGLKIGGEQRVERYDAIAIAVISASSFRDALQRAARYKQLTCPEEIQIVSRGAESTAVLFKFLMGSEVEPPVLIDLCFAWILSIARRGAGTALTPLKVEFRRGRRDQAMYREFFGCPIVFNAPDNALVFCEQDLARPFTTHNLELLGMLAPQLEAELAQRRGREDARDEVKRTIKRLLAGRRPDLSEVARALGASARTLQRRLGESGVTYQGVLEEARRELARHYLLESSLDLSATAYLLGYEDANSFFRAFHQWEGIPPGQWRDGQQKRRARAALGATRREPLKETSAAGH
jgi:AraC-like DNA-binding protein